MLSNYLINLTAKLVNNLKPTNMAKCGNCGKNLSCGCQKRTAKDGKSVCSNCIASYEAKSLPNQPVKTASTVQRKPQLWGKNRYQ